MMFRVVKDFCDLQDNNRLCRAGEEYPRPGLIVGAERIAQLASCENAIGYPLIEAVEAPIKAAEEEPKEIPAETVKPAKKAVRTRNKG